MAARYFNWKLAFILVIGTSVLIGTMFSLRHWQKSTRADQALPIGERAYEQEDWEEAAVQLGRYLAVNGDNVAVLLKYAHAQLNRRPVSSGNLMQAVAAYRSVLRFEPDNTEAVRRLTEVYLGMKQSGEAELIAERYLEGSDDPVVRRMFAVALVQQRKFSEGAVQLNRVLQEHPSEVLAYELMGQLAEQRPDDVNKPATFWFDEAVARNPESALAYAIRAGFHLRNNNRTQALADLEQAEGRNLSDVDVRLRLIRELINANATDRAREHLKVLQAESPTEQSLWRNWAEVALRAGSTEEMRTVAETGLNELAAQPWDFMPVAAELFIRAGDYERAGDCLSRMQKKDLFPSTAAFLEGLLAERQGRLREAVVAWQKALSLGYRSPVAAHMMLASVFSRLGDVQSAIGQLRTLVSSNPSYLDGHLALARLLVRVRNWPDALEEARRVQQIAPGHTEATLLELQARTYLLASATDPAVDQEKAWQDVKNRLGQLDKATDGALQVRLLQAQVAMIRGQLAEAGAILHELEETHPSDVGLALLQAELSASAGKQEEAIARFRDAVEKFPQAFEPVRALALFLNRLEKQEECESTIKEAISRAQEPSLRRELSLLLADFYRQWGQEDKQYQWLSDLTKQSPNNIQSKRQLLTCNRVVQDSKQAQKLVDEIKALEGEKGWQWRYEQARVWFSAENFQDHYAHIVKLLQENLLTNSQDQASRMLLGATYEKAGELQLALTLYREALARSPDNVQVVIRTAAALFKAEEFGEAQEILEKAAERDLYHPDLQKLQLQSHLRRGELTSASGILEQFIDQDPNNISASLSLALIHMRQKRFEEAGAILDDLKTKMPDSVSVTAAQIQLQIEQGNPAEAIKLCDETVNRLGSAFAYMLRAQTYVVLKENDKALEDFDRAITTEPKRPEIWGARADFYGSIGRIDDAVADIREALTLAPDNASIQKRAVFLLLTSGQSSLIREAETLLDKALAANAQDPQLKVFKARALLQKRTAPAIEQARRMLREVTDEHPKSAEAWEVMGRLELQQGQPGRAVDVALRGLAHSPEDKRLLLLKAHAEGIRSPMLAVPTLKVLADQYPDDMDVLVQLAGAYLDSDRPERALELLRARLANLKGPARRRCEMALATALYRIGQRDDAKLLFDTLMQADPDDPAPVLGLAQVLVWEKQWAELNPLVRRWRNGHPEDDEVMTAIARALANTRDKDALQMAEDLLRVTLARHPDSLSSLMVLGMLMQGEERHDEAAALNRKILELDPNNIIAINNLAWVLCEEQGQPEEALKLAEKGLTIAPEYMDLIDTRGVIHYRLGHLKEAAADFSKCIELYPAHLPSLAPVRFHLARVYAQMGRKTEAAEELKKALDVQDRIGGLSDEDLADARGLLDQLQKGG